MHLSYDDSSLVIITMERIGYASGILQHKAVMKPRQKWSILYAMS